MFLTEQYTKIVLMVTCIALAAGLLGGCNLTTPISNDHAIPTDTPAPPATTTTTSATDTPVSVTATPLPATPTSPAATATAPAVTPTAPAATATPTTPVSGTLAPSGILTETLNNFGLAVIKRDSATGVTFLTPKAIAALGGDTPARQTLAGTSNPHFARYAYEITSQIATTATATLTLTLAITTDPKWTGTTTWTLTFLYDGHRWLVDDLKGA